MFFQGLFASQGLRAGTLNPNSPFSSLQLCTGAWPAVLFWPQKQNQIKQLAERWKRRNIMWFLGHERRNGHENIFENCSHTVSKIGLCDSFGIQCCLYWQRKNSKESKANKIFLCLREKYKNPTACMYGKLNLMIRNSSDKGGKEEIGWKNTEMRKIQKKKWWTGRQGNGFRLGRSKGTKIKRPLRCFGCN